MKHLGAHISGGIAKAGISKISEELKIDSIQLMPTSPMMWSVKPISESNAKSLCNELNNSVIKNVLFHGIYLINLARGDKQLFHLSKMSLVTYLDFANIVSSFSKTFKVLGVTFHPGSVKDLSEEESMERIIYGLNWVLDNSQGNEKLLLESSAGAGNVMGDTFEELAKMREGVGDRSRIGYVLDTQHTFTSGYDWVNNLDGVVDDIDRILGIENIAAIHLNDSATEMGSHKDRHANLGEGKIGIDGITRIINHKKLESIPFIMETPALKDEEHFRKECTKLVNMAD